MCGSCFIGCRKDLTAVTDVVSCIEERAAADNFKVTVVAACPAGTSDITDDLSLRYLLTDISRQTAAMRIPRLGAVAVVDEDIVTVTV